MEFNKEEIFNSSPTKVLINQYNTLKDDYNKFNAIKYKENYKDQPLSFILNNSRYIFSEPICGYPFYNDIICKNNLPLYRLDSEISKVNDYLNTYGKGMDDGQKALYDKLLSNLNEIRNSKENCLNIANNTTVNPEAVDPYYDALYVVIKTNDASKLDDLKKLDIYKLPLTDAINLLINVPQLYPDLFKYLKDAYVEYPASPEDYRLNSYTVNILKRLFKDKYYYDRINLCPNTNLRAFMTDLANSDESEVIESFSESKVSLEFFSHDYISPSSLVNQIYEESLYDEALHEDYNNEIKLYTLMCERAILETNLAFSSLDVLVTEEPVRNSIIEKVYIEKGDCYNIPNDVNEHVILFKEMLNDIDNQICDITEKYFSDDFGPNKLLKDKLDPNNNKIGPSNIMKSIIGPYSDDRILNKDYIIPKKSDEDEEENDTDSDDDNDFDDTDDEASYKKREKYKERKTNKYADMNIDSEEFRGLLEAAEEIERPKDPDVLRSIQNKSMEASFKAKGALAKGKKKFMDLKNVGKAITKIPRDIGNLFKQQIEKWDDADDEKRKEYMLKPGVRKTYYRLLKWAILHSVAFMITPLLNIFLFIAQYISKSKDERIRNEFTHEIKAELKIIKKKIEDAENDPDRNKKYILMRQQDKLEAYLTRVSLNSKYA